ncbi:AAA family ATPase, partial [Pseudonocardia xinjiangensis]|uniref:AAA family ATPase n=1 Tax=Pseudonocardia xinjiangensis TaxID=75289 RepID=UPI0028AE41F0
MAQASRGRRSECGVLDRMLDAVRAGAGCALVLRGEPGVGKTFLLEYLVEQVPCGRVLRAAGVRSEMEFDFAGLHQLCAPILDVAQRLPAPQRDALRTAFGMSDGPAPDRFLVGLAALSLLADAARDRPLVCVVDDVQWLDRVSVQALTFAARRLGAESLAMIFAAREPDLVAELADLPELLVTGLTNDDAPALLGSALRGLVDQQVLDRIVDETRGNPRALLELPRGPASAELTGGFGPSDAPAIPRRIEEGLRRQLEPLEAGTRQLLLVAAAEPLGDPVLVWRAAARLGMRVEAAAPAASAGLLDIGSRVRFRHPLLRSAIYRAASAEERRTVHRALAEATDPETDPDRRAWHRAQAVAEPHEDVAAELEQSAGRAQARGGRAAAAAFLERAAELTPEPGRRRQRALVAAHATHQAGAPGAALRLLSLAEAGPLDELQRARADLLRAQISFSVNRGSDAPPLLLKAARQLQRVDVRLAREAYRDALAASMFAGPLAIGGNVREAAEAAHAAPRPMLPPRAADLLLDGLAVRFTDGYAAGMPMVTRALSLFRAPDLSAEEALESLWLACTTAAHGWDIETWDALAG